MAAIVLFAALIVAPRPANALPSFARQTGQPCGACHTDFPFLTPYGRRFKLLGYTTGGGEFRKTLFPSFPAAEPWRAQADQLRDYVKAQDSGQRYSGPSNGDAETYVPPISMMAIAGFTHTQAPLSPPTDPYRTNDNVVLSPFSGFWGGAITDNIGAFAQVTYNAPPAGGFGGNPFAHTWTWDNTDVRFAKSTTIGPLDVIYGITANNNPTVQDVWNTTPAWAFPQASSTSGLGNSGPSNSTMIEGALAAHVVGVGAYTFINDMLYLEAAAYRTLDPNAQNSLGVDPTGVGLLNNAAPYWRVALEPQWGPHSLMIGTFGMQANVSPWNPAFTATLPQSDKFTDIGFDTQYQYQGSNYWLTLRGSYIREYQKLDATFGVMGSSNPTDLLNSMRLLASFAYGGDNRIVFTGQYFNSWGTPDITLYASPTNPTGSPDSSGFTAEIAYIPFSASKAPGWPWFNTRIGLNYTYYYKANGTTIGAQDNNTLFLYAWFAM
jgi:hypothetical protein